LFLLFFAIRANGHKKELYEHLIGQREKKFLS
jgi:hypothetical protein